MQSDDVIAPEAHQIGADAANMFKSGKDEGSRQPQLFFLHFIYTVNNRLFIY